MLRHNNSGWGQGETRLCWVAWCCVTRTVGGGKVRHGFVGWLDAVSQQQWVGIGGGKVRHSFVGWLECKYKVDLGP